MYVLVAKDTGVRVVVVKRDFARDICDVHVRIQNHCGDKLPRGYFPLLAAIIIELAINSFVDTS